MPWDQPVSIRGHGRLWLRGDDRVNSPALDLMDEHEQHVDFGGGGVDRDLGQPSRVQSVNREDEDLACFGVLVRGHAAVHLEVADSVGQGLSRGGPS